MSNKEKIVTTGAPSLQPTAPPRLEITDMKTKFPKQWSLFIHALNQWNKDLADDKDDSFFAVAGIHGLPFEQWNEAGDRDPAGGVGNGYCQHKTILFPTWHRPYLALYEQVLNRYALQVAATFTSDREGWLKEAADLRAPYWDWARYPLPPAEVYDYQTYPKVSVTLTDGTTGTVLNPLPNYKFKENHGPPVPDDWSSDPDVQAFTAHPTTVRHPTAVQGPIQGFRAAVGADRVYKARRRSTATLCLDVKTWPSFSTGQVITSGTVTNSLEAIHDNIHGACGGPGGHMSAIPWASFDPIFWLHHCNVDRVFALWQTIHPRVWVSKGNMGEESSWDLAPDTPIDGATDLLPFRSANSLQDDQWWKSNDIVQWKQMQYTYPDFDGVDLANETAASAAIRKLVEGLYRDPFPGRVAAPARRPAADHAAFAHSAAQAVAAPVTAALATAQSHLAAGTGHGNPADWTARIRCKKVEAVGIDSFALFLGGVPDDSSNNVADDRYVGAWNPFVNPMTSACKNCVDTADVRIEGFVHLNDSLLERGIDVGNISGVENYLKDNLKWVPVTAGGRFKRSEDVPSLEVLVIDTPLRETDHWRSPEVDHLRKHNEITFDKPGGRVRDPNRA